MPLHIQVPALRLSWPVCQQLWRHAQRDAPQECVGFLGGVTGPELWTATLVCPIPNIAPHPRSEYLAQPQATLRTLKEFAAQDLKLVGIYHSHPRGPAHYSAQDKAQAGYDVPYLIADLSTGQLVAYWLPAGEVCKLVPVEAQKKPLP